MTTTMTSTAVQFNDGTIQSSAALPALVAGSEIHARSDGNVSQSGTTYSTKFQVTFVQHGTVRIAANAYSTVSGEGDYLVRRVRNGSTSLSYTNNLTTTTTLYTSDISVKPGDTIDWLVRGGATGVGHILNMRMSTNGQEYFPVTPDVGYAIRTENN